MTNAEPSREDLVYDWNTVSEIARPPHEIEFDDETLRDGLQGPSIANPTIEQKIELLHLMDGLGLDTADVGLPGAGPHVVADVTRLVEEIRDARLSITPNCAGRTMIADLRPVAEIQQKTGVPIEACAFIGSSKIRAFTEDWDMQRMLGHVRTSLKFAKEEGLAVMFVTEDTTRAHPDDIRALYGAALDEGADRLCFCDTVGHSTPDGTRALIEFAVKLVEERGRTGEVKIDWHGHMDRGLGVWNNIAAAQAGAHRIHGSALGIGERCGNAPIDVTLVNMKLLGWIDNDLHGLAAYVNKTSEFTGVPVPGGYPAFGSDAFETGTGVHAAAVIKALRKGDEWLANRVYSGVPADDYGLEQKILVGPMSGKSNVIYWLEKHGYPASETRVEKLFDAAKASNRNLADEDLHGLARSIQGDTAESVVEYP